MDNKGNFRRLLAAFFSCSSFIYITAITFCYVPPENMDNAKTIMGFLLGATIASIVNYYYGDAEKKE